jgi:Fe-S-cluster-containing dehydrogenase component
MMKCDFCAGRQAQGLQPACVEACPYLALDSGSEAELRDRHGPLVALAAGALPGIDEEHASTRPAVFVRSRPLRSAPGAPVTLRKNGVAVPHLRTAAQADPEAWRARARTPYREKDKKNACE